MVWESVNSKEHRMHTQKRVMKLLMAASAALLSGCGQEALTAKADWATEPSGVQTTILKGAVTDSSPVAAPAEALLKSQPSATSQGAPHVFSDPLEKAAPALTAQQFAKLHAMIKPLPGQFAWREEIPWLTSIQEARVKAAAEQKPMLIWVAADGQPLGSC
jgi:hypothetical protein